MSQPWGGRVWEGEAHFWKGFCSLNFLFFQKFYSYREMKQFPDLRQLADCPIPEGSQVGAKSGQTGQVRAAPSLAVQGDKEKERERQVLTPQWPCGHPISPIFPPLQPLSTNYNHTNKWEKFRMAQTHLDTKNRSTFSNKTQEGKKIKRIHSLATTAQLKPPKKPPAMVWNVKGWRGTSKATWFGEFACVCLSYTKLGTMRDDSRSALSINLAWLTWLPVLIDLHRIDPSTPWSLNPALESRQPINSHRNLYPTGLDLEERWSRCLLMYF